MNHTLHHGQIIEKTIRRNGHSITDIARLTNVNRRSVYNWFNQRRLKPEIIYRIGQCINHDFTSELPELMVTEEFATVNIQHRNQMPYPGPTESEEVNYWKDKYIQLLETYNNHLNKERQKAVYVLALISLSHVLLYSFGSGMNFMA